MELVEQRATVATPPQDSSTPARSGDRVRGPDLCTSCGLCCMGALHNAAVLDEDEIAPARALGLPVLDRAKPGFALPCPRLAGTLCTIYGERPRVCGRYRCRLLQELESGDVSFEVACDRVRTANGLVAALQALLPPATTLPQARADVLRPITEEPEEDRGGAMRLRLATTAAMVYIDRHFRNDREGKLLASSPIDPHPALEKR